jgi:ribosomal protein L37AE/L43A
MIYRLRIGHYEVVYQDSNGEWKPVISNLIEKNSSGELVNDHICPACGNNRCSRQEIKCWRCGNKL